MATELLKLAKTSLPAREQKIVNVMHAIGDGTRYKMLKMLLKNKEICVSDIAKRLGISVSAVSQHFRIFELNGLVTKKRKGLQICYLVDYSNPFVERFLRFIK